MMEAELQHDRMEAGRRASWDGFLHRLYSWTSRAQFLAASRIRPAGLAVGSMFILVACLAVGHDRSSVYQMFSLVMTMQILAVPLAFSRRARLHAVRHIPRHASAGSPLRYTVVVTNAGRRRLSRAWLREMVPDPRPSLDEFLILREPGEEERNIFDRTFAWFRWQWLVMRKKLFDGGFSPVELDLAPGESARVAIELTPRRRGVIRLDRMRALLPDPFGLLQSNVTVEAAASTVTVLPRRYRLPVLELPGCAAFQLTGESSTNAVGNSGEFTGLRDYRPGDPLRQIHWKSWARVGRPIVKELEDTFYPRHGLVLDTLSRDRTDVVFEECVSVAASFAASLDTSDTLLDLMFVGDRAHVVTAGRGIERADKLLEVLAGVNPTRTGGLDALARLVLMHAADLTSCVVILNGWDKEREQLIHRLREGGVLCAVLVIGSGPRPPGVPGMWLNAATIARDLMNLPRQLPVS